MNDQDQDAAPALPPPIATPRSFTLWVSDEDQNAFEQLRDRWNRVLAWTDPQGRSASDLIKEPTLRQMLSEWKSFASLWEQGDEDTDGLFTQARNLDIIENRARDFGYDDPGGSVRVPTVDDNPILRGVDQAGEALDQAGLPVTSPSAPAAAGRTIGEWWSRVPKAYKAGGALAVGGVVLYQLNRLLGAVASLAGKKVGTP